MTKAEALVAEGRDLLAELEPAEERLWRLAEVVYELTEGDGMSLSNAGRVLGGAAPSGMRVSGRPGSGSRAAGVRGSAGALTDLDAPR